MHRCCFASQEDAQKVANILRNDGHTAVVDEYHVTTSASNAEINTAVAAYRASKPW